MAKSVIKNYTFNTSAKTITLTDVTAVRLDKLALITDVTTNKILYNFADSSISTATVATNVITLSALQGGENNTDKLRIDYDVDTTDTAFGDTTESVKVLSSALPTGAATSAKQPALGTAGTPSADVITVQGATSMTALKVDGTGGSFPVSGTVSITSNSAVNVAQINGVTPLMGNGATGTGSQRVTIASDNTPFAVKTDQTTHGTTDLVAADITKVAGSAISQGHGTAATAIRVELPTDGTGVVGLATGTNNIGFVTPTPSTTGGWTKWSTPKNNSNTALVAPAGGINVSSAACTLGGYMIYNPNSTAAYVQVFDLAGATATLGTTRPDMVLAIPGLSAANLEMVNGVKFTNGITVAATTTDSGAVAVSTGLTVTLWYK